MYNNTFNKPSYKLRLGTKNKEDVQIIINELEKVFKVGEYDSYEHRNKQGYYSYFDIELMNNNEQAKINRLQEEINRLESQIQSLKLENSKLQNKIECSTIKNERGAGRRKKFNTEQVNAILEARDEGKSIRLLAKEFNCSIGLIHKLINEHNK